MWLEVIVLDKAKILGELKVLAISYLVFVFVLFMVFYKSDFWTVFRVVSSIYWMFILPGYFVSLLIYLDFLERFIIGISIQTALFGLISYYVGLLGWHVFSHGIFIPLLIMLFVLLFIIRK